MLFYRAYANRETAENCLGRIVLPKEMRDKIRYESLGNYESLMTLENFRRDQKLELHL